MPHRVAIPRVVERVVERVVATETTPLVSRRDENVRRRRLKFAATTLVTTLGAMVGIMLLRNDKTMQNDGHALVDLGDGSRIGVDEYFNSYVKERMALDARDLEDYFSKMNTSAFESVLDEEPELGVSVETAAEAEHVRLLIVRDELMMRLRKQRDDAYGEANAALLGGAAGDVNAVSGGVHTATGARFCWKDSYGRGVGTLPTDCPSNKERIAGGLFCYKKCSEFSGSWKRFGYDCHQQCKSGWTDTGLFCAKSYSYGRGAGRAMTMTYTNKNVRYTCGTECSKNCKKSVSYPCGTTCKKHKKKWGRKWCVSWGTKYCSRSVSYCCATRAKMCNKNVRVPNGLKCTDSSRPEQQAALCYPKCRSGYSGKGPVCWASEPNCVKEGYKGGALGNCAKKIEMSPGRESAGCGSKEKDAGLCYPESRSSYSGQGPVCWGEPPSGWVQCGMGAASSSSMCATAVTDQVMGPLEMTAFAVSFGGSAGASRASKANDLPMLKKLGSKIDDCIRAVSKTSSAKNIKKAADVLLDALNAAGAAGTIMDATLTMSSCELEVDCIRGVATFLSLFDDTGVTSTVAATRGQSAIKSPARSRAQSRCQRVEMHPISEDIVKRMEGVNDPEDWSPCSDCLFYKHVNDANFVLYL